MVSSCCFYKPGLPMETAGLSCFCVVHLKILSPRSDKCSGYHSLPRPTASVQISQGKQMFLGYVGWGGGVSVSLPLPSPRSSSLCSVETQSQNLLHATQLLYPEPQSWQCPPFSTFPNMTMEATHESLHWSSAWKPSIAIRMQTRLPTGEKNLPMVCHLYFPPFLPTFRQL